MKKVSEIVAKTRECFLFKQTKDFVRRNKDNHCYRRWCFISKITKTTEGTVLAYFKTELASYKTFSL